MKHITWIALGVLFACSTPSRDASYGVRGPMRIVITNDDGVETLDDRIMPLAEALLPFAEVFVVVPRENKSGTTHMVSVGANKRALESELIASRPAGDAKHRLEVHRVDGFPADCVALALRGLLDEPPDLLIFRAQQGPQPRTRLDVLGHGRRRANGRRSSARRRSRSRVWTLTCPVRPSRSGAGSPRWRAHRSCSTSSPAGT